MTVQPITVAYIPESDPDALNWMQNFHRIVKVRPAAFGVDARDLATLDDLIRNFSEKSETMHAPAERIIARNAAVRAVQRLAQHIAAHPLTSDDDLSLLGLPAKCADR